MLWRFENVLAAGATTPQALMTARAEGVVSHVRRRLPSPRRRACERAAAVHEPGTESLKCRLALAGRATDQVPVLAFRHRLRERRDQPPASRSSST
jgi:hypothetical protein